MTPNSEPSRWFEINLSNMLIEQENIGSFTLTQLKQKVLAKLGEGRFTNDDLVRMLSDPQFGGIPTIIAIF